MKKHTIFTSKNFLLLLIISCLSACLHKQPKKVQVPIIKPSPAQVEITRLQSQTLNPNSDEDITIIIDQEIKKATTPTLSEISEEEKQQPLSPNNDSDKQPLLHTKTPIYTHANTKIAVLIPLTGEYQHIGLTLQKGLIQTYFNLSHKPASLTFYDSNTAQINRQYQQIVKEQYDIVIGPLTPEKINKINYSSEVTNLVLNQFDQPNDLINSVLAFDFKEYSHTEINQLTQYIQKMQHNNVLLIVENTISGEIFADKFSDNWFDQNKSINKIIYLSNNLTDNAKQIRQYLTTYPKLNRYQYADNGRLKKTATLEDDFPFIRQDIDAIALSINVANARLIVPLMNTIGGAKPIIYASSLLVKSDDFKLSKEAGLNTIRYLDSPWKYTQENPDFLLSLMNDALRISLSSQIYSSFNYAGLTGFYTISATKGMQRKQYWYQFKRGSATPLQSITN